jgi:hypothetical protein
VSKVVRGLFSFRIVAYHRNCSEFGIRRFRSGLGIFGRSGTLIRVERKWETSFLNKDIGENVQGSDGSELVSLDSV